jgi:hypothetical protein
VSFHAACRFFSRGLGRRPAGTAGGAAARRPVAGPGAPVVVVVDDTLFRRWGRKVHHASWTHDGAAQGKH